MGRPETNKRGLNQNQRRRPPGQNGLNQNQRRDRSAWARPKGFILNTATEAAGAGRFKPKPATEAATGTITYQNGPAGNQQKMFKPKPATEDGLNQNQRHNNTDQPLAGFGRMTGFPTQGRRHCLRPLLFTKPFDYVPPSFGKKDCK